MALFTVEIPEKLWSKLKLTGRPAQEVIVEALEQTLENNLSVQSQEPSHEELAKRLLEIGFVRNPEEYENSDVREWLALPEVEREKLIAEMQAIWFPDSFVSQTIIEDRR